MADDRTALLALIDPLLGTAYSQYDCWGLVRHLVHAGKGVDLLADPQHLNLHIHEVWFEDDPRPPWELVRSWDLLLLCVKGLAADHVGLVVDPTCYVHTRPKTGVVLEPLRRARYRLLQLVRLRQVVS